MGDHKDIRTFGDLTEQGAVPPTAQNELGRWGATPKATKSFEDHDLPEMRETVLDLEKLMARPETVTFQTSHGELTVYAGVDVLGSLHVELPPSVALLVALQSVKAGTAVMTATGSKTVRRVRSIYTEEALTHYLFEVE